MRSDKLLRIFVESVLKEDDGGGDFGIGVSGGMVGGGMGMYSVGTNKGLYDIFVKPFVEVVQTASGVTKETMRVAVGTVRVALEFVLTTFIPFIRDTYQQIFKEQQQDIDAIREKYKNIYASNTEMFSHGDMNVLAFGYDPVHYITSAFLRKSPKAAAKAIELITGDDARIQHWLRTFGEIYKFEDYPQKSQRRREALDLVGAMLHEADEKSPDERAQELLIEMLNDPDVIDAIEDSRTVRAMQADSKKVILKLYNAAKEGAEAIDGVNDFASLKEFVKKFKNNDAMNALEKLEKLPDQQRADLIPKFVEQVKKMYKGVFASGIDAQISEAKRIGMGDDSELVTVLRKAMNIVSHV